RAGRTGARRPGLLQTASCSPPTNPRRTPAQRPGPLRYRPHRPERKLPWWAELRYLGQLGSVFHPARVAVAELERDNRPAGRDGGAPRSGSGLVRTLRRRTGRGRRLTCASGIASDAPCPDLIRALRPVKSAYPEYRRGRVTS